MKSDTSLYEITDPINLEDYSLLVAEDDVFCFEFMKHFLSETRANLVYAETGAHAIEIINKRHIDLVFLDLHLPDMNGFEVLNMIRQTYRNLPVIAQTSFTFHKDQERIYKAGFNDLVIKPFSKKYLYDILNKYFNNVLQECKVT